VTLTAAILQSLNGLGFYQMFLQRDANEVPNGSNLDWLRPFTISRHLKTGNLLFSRDDPADSIALILSGRLRIDALSIDFIPGQVVGEMGFGSPVRHRTQTVVCAESGDILEIESAMVRRLYSQNPQIGFLLLRLITQCLFDNIVNLEQSLTAFSSRGAGERIRSALAHSRMQSLDIHAHVLWRALELEQAISDL
jgi:CRP-like cAMP-binding protein